MSSTAANNAAGPRQVICKTSDQKQILAEIDVLRLSGTFETMYRDLGLGENDCFPDVFHVPTISARALRRIIAWCKRQRGQPTPCVTKDPLTQECIWFRFTKSDRRFFRVPIDELLELVMASSYLDIDSLYQYACQAIAALIKGKRPVEIRRILRQRADLNLGEYADILASLPWLDPATAIHDPLADDSEDTLDIPSEVLVTIFEKLSRADLERLQLVNEQFRDIILTVGKLGKEHGPLRRLRMIKIGAASSDGHHIYLQDGTHILCPDFSTLVRRLSFCATELLSFAIWKEPCDEPLRLLLPSKATWKNATVEAFTNNFGSEEEFTFAYTDLFLGKKILLVEMIPASFVPTSFLRLPAMVECNELHIGHLPQLVDLGAQRYSIEVDDIVEWLEREERNKWDEPSRLAVAGHAIKGGHHGLIETLTKDFLAASRPNTYVVRIRFTMLQSLPQVDVDEQYHENKTTHEEFRVRMDDDGNSVDAYVLVERKYASSDV